MGNVPSFVPKEKSTLVIHPKDKTTTFLELIYQDIKNKTVVTGDLRRSEILKLIQEHDRVIMLGHGTPNGLLNLGQFPDSSYVIDKQMVSLLSEKVGNVFIWCHADEYVERNKLNGFYSGMFISEVSESFAEGLRGIQQDTVTESNLEFSNCLGQCINESTDTIFDTVIHEYGKLTSTNPVANVNHRRLYKS